MKLLCSQWQMSRVWKARKNLSIMSFAIHQSLNELIQQTWKLKNASIILERKKQCQMDIIPEAAAGQCVQGCEGMWLKCAEEVLYYNKVHPILYAAVRELLTLGRGKLKPLLLLFDTFSNPAADKYAWVGADKK